MSEEEIDALLPTVRGTRPAIIEQIKQSKFICSACGSGRDCDCSAPARLRAIEAIKADPDRSDRAIAKGIGVHHSTVNEARRQLSDYPTVERTGLDGKTRKVPEKKAATNKTSEPPLQTRPIIVEDQDERFAKLPAETLARVIFETCGTAKADAVAKELNKLIAVADNDVPTDASAETMKAKYDELLSEDDLSIPACLRRMS